MKWIFSLTNILIVASTLARTPVEGDKICGQWENENGNSHIEIYKQSGKYFGKIIWLEEPNTATGEPKTDENNPDPAMRNRPLEGLVIIHDLKYRNDKWEGTIYSPRKGQTVNCSLSLNADGTLNVTASKSFFSITKVWTRI